MDKSDSLEEAIRAYAVLAKHTKHKLAVSTYMGLPNGVKCEQCKQFMFAISTTNMNFIRTVAL